MCEGKRRPEVLYRAVHEEHPGNGLQSRGFGTIKTDHVSFMLHFLHHLNWRSRNASPFMSTTISAAKAANVADWYERHGHKNIEILVIKLDEIGGEPEPKVWDAMRTASQFRLQKVLRKPRWYYGGEYLIEDLIPESCVTRGRWEEMKADIDAETRETRDMGGSQKRKRSISEDDGPGDETVLSDGQSRKVWGVVKDISGRGRQCYLSR